MNVMSCTTTSLHQNHFLGVAMISEHAIVGEIHRHESLPVLFDTFLYRFYIDDLGFNRTGVIT